MIFYLSGTGNSLWAAKNVAETTGDKLFSIIDALKGDCRFTLTDGESVGFVFPVHGWRPPKLVRRFAGKITIGGIEGHYTYALVTAGDNIGETIDILESDLQKRGIHLDAAFSLIMPESYVGLPFMDVDTPEKERQKIETSEKRLARYAQAIKAHKEGKRELDIGRWRRINSRIIGGVFTNCLISDKNFHVARDKCIRCGRCVEVCPVADIHGGKGETPSWKHNGDCMTCFSCYHHCPVHAIEFGNRTKNKGQYYFGKNNINKV